MSTERKVKTGEFLESHSVFNLDEAVSALNPGGGRRSVVERLKHHVAQGRLLRVARELYAAVPHGVSPARFHPDPFLVGRAARPEGVFAYHAAFELLGVAHSIWNEYCLYTDRRRSPLKLSNASIQFLCHPENLLNHGKHLGTRQIERNGYLLRVTGPERTLVEGFRRPHKTGGLEETINCAAASPSIDLKTLWEVLEAYNSQVLWAAIGWFLERYQNQFHVPDPYLEKLEAKSPQSARYLQRQQRGGNLVIRWNLIVPSIANYGEPDER